MPHYAGSGTNFSEERKRMSETTPENGPDYTDPGDGSNDGGQPAPSTPPTGDQAPDNGDAGNSNPDAVTDGSVAEEGQPE